MNAVCEDESSESGSSAAWLVQLLGAHAELVDRVVPVCRCVVLLHLTERMQRRVMQSRQPVTFKAPSASAAHTPHEQSVDSEQAAAHDAAIRRAVLASLRRVVQTSSDALLPACEVLAFFMQRLSAATLGWRRLANRCLLDLLVTDQSATTSLQDYNSLRWMELLANLSTSSTVFFFFLRFLFNTYFCFVFLCSVLCKVLWQMDCWLLLVWKLTWCG